MKASQRILVSIATSSVRLHRWAARFRTEYEEDTTRFLVAIVANLLAAVLATVIVFRRSAQGKSVTCFRAIRRIGRLAVPVGLPVLMFIAFEHHSIQTSRSKFRPVDPNFYEVEHHKYQPRPMQELYYAEGGIYRTVHDDTQVFFRGINLPAKTPSHPPHLRSTANATNNFYESHRTVSFVDRPFPLLEADEHFHRLATLGFNLIRLSVSWEAVMHAGPGKIDTDYLAYLRDLVRLAGTHGLYVLVDPHQDVWSRFTGGSGAPGWTLEAAGFRLDSSLHEAGCAYLHQHLGEGGRLPTMAWPTNYGRLATATMFTLFFAGDEYAPNITVPYSDEETIQQYLRRHYLTFIRATADALKDEINVIGVETMNEPSNGFVGVEDLRDLVMPAPYLSAVTGFDSMRLGSGESVDIDFYSSPFVFEETVKLNKEGRSCWLDDRDVWQKMGIYEIDETTGERSLTRPHNFRRQRDDFLEQFMVPFYEEIQQVVSSVNTRFVTYASPHIDVMNPSTPFVPDELLSPERKFGWAPHFYDAATLLLKSYSNWFALDLDYKLPVFTPTLIAKSFGRMLGSVKATGREKLHVIVGETGVPFDLINEEHAAHSMSINALDRTINGMERNMLEYILWNYMPYNTAVQGDWWNGENLSIRSDGENRGIDAVARPYVYGIKGKGRVLTQNFDMLASTYQLEVEIDCYANSNGEVPEKASFVIFLPHYHFPLALTSITPKSGDAEINLAGSRQQTIVWTVRECNDGLTITYVPLGPCCAVVHGV